MNTGGRAARLRPLPDRVEVHVLAVVLRLLVGPDRAHGLDALAHVAVARGRVGAVVEHLLLVPARADAEHEAPAGQHVERGDLLGQHDRVVLDHQAHARPDDQLLRRRRGEGQRDERVVRAAVLVLEHAAVAGDHAGRDRDVRVLGQEQRLVAALLGLAAPARQGGSRRRRGTSPGRPSCRRPAARCRAATALTSRWRRPKASAKRYATRLRKHVMPSADALGRHRGHLHLGQPAGHDPVERVQVVVDVDREAVRRDAVGDVHADRRDLALADPHADVLVAELGAAPRRPRRRARAPAPAPS